MTPGTGSSHRDSIGTGYLLNEDTLEVDDGVDDIEHFAQILESSGKIQIY